MDVKKVAAMLDTSKMAALENSLWVADRVGTLMTAALVDAF